MDYPQPAYSGSDPFIFVSYAHKDSEIVYPEILWLQQQGFNIWWDQGIGGGNRWRDEIADSIENCKLFLFYASENAVESTVCREELEFALSHQCKVLVSHLDATTMPAGLQLAVSNRQALLRHKMTALEYEEKLLEAVAAGLQQTPKTPATRLKTVSASKKIKQALPVLAAGLLGIALTWFFTLPSPAPLKPSPKSVLILPEMVSSTGSTYVTINRKGTRVFAILGGKYPEKTVYRKEINELAFKPIAGSDLDRNLAGVFPNPDGTRLLLALRNGSLAEISADGGQPVPVAKTSNGILYFHGRWRDNSRFLVGDAQGIQEIAPESEVTSKVILAGSFGLPYPIGETAMLATQAISDKGVASPTTKIVMVKDGGTTQLVNGSDPRLTPRNQLLFLRDKKVWAAMLSQDFKELETEPVIVLDKVASNPFRAEYDFADTGEMVYVPEQEQTMALKWVSVSGLSKRIQLPPTVITSAALAPDSQRIAYTSGDEVWVHSVEQDLSTRLLKEPGQMTSVQFSPDGAFIAVTMNGGSIRRLFLVHTVTGEKKLLVEGERSQRAGSFSADGKTLLYEDCLSFNVDCDIKALRLDAEAEPVTVVETGFNERLPHISRNGNYLAYSTNRFGPRRIVVRPYPETDRTLWQIPLDNCLEAEWANSDSQLIVTCDRVTYSIDVNFDEDAPFEPADRMLELNRNAFFRQFSEIRQQFMVLEAELRYPVVALISNWFDEIERTISEGQSPNARPD